VILTFAELSGVDKFCFVQPKDRKSSLTDWWKATYGDAAEKTLKVTQLQVAQLFPACVTRQVVLHRLVYSQSPLEAGVDAICEWCAVLFRTAVATSGQAVMQQNAEPGIGSDAAKVVADCIHSSNVKAIGISLLKNISDVTDSESTTEFTHEYDRLTDDELTKLRVTLSRLIVVYIELLHLLIARNRDQLLDIIQVRKKGKRDSHRPHLTASVGGRSSGRSASNGRPTSNDARRDSRHDHRREFSDPSPSRGHGRNLSRATVSSTEGRSLQTTNPTKEPKVRHHSVSETPKLKAPELKVRHHSASEAPSSFTRGSGHVVHQRRNSTGETSVAARTDAAIAVQSELQRGFINLCRVLHPRISIVLQDETPRWMKNCTQDNYFSLGTYRQSKIMIADEFCFSASTEGLRPPGGGIVLGGPPADVETISSRHGSGGGSSNSVMSKGSYGREYNAGGM
jgi:hypothetical protein